MDIQTINERWRNAVDADTREIIATDAEALGFRYKACDCPGEWRKPACSDNAFGAPYDKPKPTGNAVTAPRPLGWYGGKAYGGKAEWINSHLPAPHSAQLYAEPFGGMAGVLMARQPAGCEIVNDLNGRIINWWEVVRDAPDEFAALVEFTPHSRTAFERAISDMDNESLPPIRRALAFHIVVTQNIRSTDNAKHSTDWRISYRRFKSAEWTAQRIYALARRMRLVQLECKPAVDFMARIADNADAVVYVDPPYVSADVSDRKSVV